MHLSKHLLQLGLVHHAVTVGVEASKVLLHPFGQLVLAPLAIVVLVELLEVLQEPLAVGAAIGIPLRGSLRSTRAVGTTGQHGAQREHQLFAVDLAIAVAIEAFESLVGLGQLVGRDLAILVGVEQPQQRIRWATKTDRRVAATGLTRPIRIAWATGFAGALRSAAKGLRELVARQALVAIFVGTLDHLGKPFTAILGHFIDRDLAVLVGIELLEQPCGCSGGTIAASFASRPFAALATAARLFGRAHQELFEAELAVLVPIAAEQPGEQELLLGGNFVGGHHAIAVGVELVEQRAAFVILFARLVLSLGLHRERGQQGRAAERIKSRSSHGSRSPQRKEYQGHPTPERTKLARRSFNNNSEFVPSNPERPAKFRRAPLASRHR